MAEDAGTPEAPKKKAKKAAPLIPKLPECGFLIQGTKNGGFPIRSEKRSYKKVTIIENVVGAAEVLCRELRTRLGTGIISFLYSKRLYFPAAVPGVLRNALRPFFLNGEG